MIKRIHVNQHIIKANRATGANEAPITVKTYNRNVRASRVVIDGPSTLVYEPDSPLACGARLWIETHAPVLASHPGSDTIEL